VDSIVASCSNFLNCTHEATGEKHRHLGTREAWHPRQESPHTFTFTYTFNFVFGQGWGGWEAWDLRRGHLDFAFSVTLNKQIQLALARRGLEARLDVDALVCDTDIAKLDDWRNAVQHTTPPPTPPPTPKMHPDNRVSATGECDNRVAGECEQQERVST
jgi:hypothetical protein